jgi:hypothetical protein
MGGRRKPVPAELSAQGESAIRAARLKRRRARSREYMQEWRANPQHREAERKRRDRDYLIREQRNAHRLRLRPYTGVQGQPQCGFCGHGRPVEIVERLRISETADEEYVKEFIPYCGHC